MRDSKLKCLPHRYLRIPSVQVWKKTWRIWKTSYWVLKKIPPRILQKSTVLDLLAQRNRDEYVIELGKFTTNDSNLLI